MKLSIRKTPEVTLSKPLIRYMQSRGWYCGKIGGGKYNRGWPDWYCFHREHGHRWLEMKAGHNKLTAYQKKKFYELSQAGDRIYVVVVDTNSAEVLYRRLFSEHDNWSLFI